MFHVLFAMKSGHTLNLADLILASSVALLSILMIFLSCLLGDMVTSQFDSFDMEFNQCNWYLYPSEIQQILVMVMLSNQQPVIIHGYANTFCTRKAFRKVTFFMWI